MTSPAPPRRRWFRYSLRTLFVLVTLMAVLLAWIGVQLKWIHDRHELSPHYNRTTVVYKAYHHYDETHPYKTAPYKTAPWSLRVFGEKGVDEIEIDRDQSGSAQESERQRLGSLFPESDLVERPKRSAHQRPAPQL